MKKVLSRGRIVVATGVAVLAVAGGAFAFTAANTVPASKAGDGAGAITGFAISNIHYVLNASVVDAVDAVTFDIDTPAPAGSTLRASFVDGGDVYSCTAAGTAVTCNTTSPQLTVLPTDNAHVVIAQ